jgi:hypothetical protein
LTDQADNPRYAETWRQFRKWRLIFWCMWLGYIPAMIAMVMLWSLVFPRRDDSFAPFVFFGGWALLWLGAAHRAWGIRCPRCGNRFFVKWYHNQFARRCLHCKLPRYVTHDPDASH